MITIVLNQINSVYIDEKKRKSICNEEIVKYNKSLEDINYINEYSNKKDTKKFIEDDKFRMVYKLDLITLHK